MSSTLLWRPVMPVEGFSLPYELKKTLSRRLWDTDGSIGGGEASMTEDDIPYLEGLRDAGVRGAEELIEVLRKHSLIVLWHQH